MSRTSLSLFSKNSQHSSCYAAGAKPSRLNKKAYVFLLERCRSINSLKQIHSQVLVSGLDQSRDIVNDLLVFLTEPSSGDLHYAFKLFDSLRNPYLFVFNLMIKALSKKGNHKNSIFLFSRMREESLSPDNFTYPFVFKAFGCLRLDSDGRKTHGLVSKSGFEFDPFVRNSMIDMYAELGNIKTSRLLFDEMPQRDVVTWNVLIASYVKCREFEMAISVFKEMEKVGVKADEATLVSSISACIALRNLEQGMKIHSYMKKEYQFSLPLGNAILDMYAKCSNVDAAFDFFESMPIRNVITWTTMVSGYVNVGQLDEAKRLFDRSPIKDVVLWTAMINGYVQHNEFDEALAMFREMQMKKIKPDKFTIVALLTLCANVGALDQGKWIHRYIADNNMRIDNVVSTALIDMYAKCGSVEKSLEIFREAKEKDRVTWTSMICGLALNGQTHEAIELFYEMKALEFKPDDITFIGVLSACCHGGLVEEGRRHFYEMKVVHRIEPKIEHYGCLVDLLGRAGHLDEAEQLIESISYENNADALPLLGAFLGACRIHGNIEIGKRLAMQFVKYETVNSGLHTLIANIYAAADMWEDATQVRKKIKNFGAKKIPGCSSIEVNGLISEFVVDDTEHIATADIFAVLNGLSRLMEMEEMVGCVSSRVVETNT
ncbi:pentatricopeptide repeat-containing protein At1g31430 [Phalaenopsis equestris]|uniref:pentatricopeptide repeat-containing protein At1g31430 n=1 Tax=Phalaenopsis equestris TaxID=78828 RepID=UPI0009E52821|nr:pentatricopeptide repeat-containing protein At1g31430 [Phalaenopsis equestris]